MDGRGFDRLVRGAAAAGTSRRRLCASAGAALLGGFVGGWFLGGGASARASAQATGTSATQGAGTQGATAAQLRTTLLLSEGWRFVQDDTLSDTEALRASGEAWERVSLPHTWNAEDAASLDATGYKRGLGWYRLAFETPTTGVRHWLEFGAAGLVADVWLNGRYLGQHRGGYTAFRFDVTDQLDSIAPNDLLVKVDNREPTSDDDPTAIIPLGGDYNKYGGLYRYVALVSTVAPVHFDLGDMGGLGVYATTTSIDDSGATVNVLAKVTSDAVEGGDYLARISLIGDLGRVAASAEQPVRLEAGDARAVEQELRVDGARLWQGRADPYQYQLVADLLGPDGDPVDRVVQNFGIRFMRFDPSDGFVLNGEPMRLHGVAIHQDYLGKGSALSREDWDTSFDLIMEIGANAVRLGHYPFPEYALDKADQLGLVAWAEKPNGQRLSLDSCAATGLPADFVENARQQLEETIRQQYNHASIAVWAVGNETDFGLLSCDDPVDTVRPFLREMHALAKELDPSRVTGYAEYGHPVERSGYAATEGITDVFGTNRYFLWYTPEFSQMGPLLDGLNDLTAEQPLALTEYGIGAALSHHTDNPRGGYPDVRSAPEGEVSWQPEEYQAWAHGQNYRVIDSKDYLFGSFVWNMFDFGSDHRREGDVTGVNTKGLARFGRQTRKDAFFFYKANWSIDLMAHIVGRRYRDRAYAVNDVTVYSNADSVELSVNGTVVGALTAAEADFGAFVFEEVRLERGENAVVAVGDHGGETVRDVEVWTFDNEGVHIAAGRIATGFTTSSGVRFGSDAFFSGGSYGQLNPSSVPTPNDVGPEEGAPGLADIGDLGLYEYFRQGQFSYDIPLEDGTYEVSLGFIEPDSETRIGERVFDVLANGETLIGGFDIRAQAGTFGFPVPRRFTVEVSGGRLALAFVPRAGDAIVSYILVNAA